MRARVCVCVCACLCVCVFECMCTSMMSVWGYYTKRQCLPNMLRSLVSAHCVIIYEKPERHVSQSFISQINVSQSFISQINVS